MSETFVVPLESNPDVLNKFLAKVGVSGNYQLTDVFGLEEDLLGMLPPDVRAFILLFPCTENYENFRKTEDAELQAKGEPIPKEVFYMRQYLRNACGTIALFHAILNNLDKIELTEGSALKSFYDKAKDLSPEERGKLLEQDNDIVNIHQSLAREGQTEAPPEDEKILFHYAAITKVGDQLYELDGRKNFPIVHGKTSDGTFLADAANVCKEFMKRDPNEVRFTVMAIAAAGDQ